MCVEKGFFSLFPRFKKVRHYLRALGRHCLRTRGHGRRQLMTSPMALEEEPEEELDDDVEKMEFDGCWWGCEWVPARQQYCWWVAAADGSQIGHTIWRPPWLIGRGPGWPIDRQWMVPLPGCYRDRYAQCILDVVVATPVVAYDRDEWVQTVQKRSGSSASAVLVVVDVAVSMRRQVPVLPGGASDQSIDKVVDCVCVFFRRFTHFLHPSEGSACPFFSPRALTAVSARGLLGCDSASGLPICS